MSATDTADQDRKEKRRQRLQELRGNRTDETAQVVAAAPSSPKALREEFGLAAAGTGRGGAGRGGAGRGGAGRGGAGLAALADGDDNDARRKAIGRIVRLLSDTPADATGMVPDTPFSKAGVAKLMDMVKTRTSDQSANGAKVAGGLMKFLGAKDGEDSVHGVSVEKLQRAAKMVGKRGGKGKGKGKRGGI